MDFQDFNLLFKSDNLDVLKALKKTHTNAVKCVYLDPPYNTGINRKHFKDDESSAEWLSMMRERLKIAKILLKDDGSIWISIDDTQLYNLKLLCDEIFGKDNFLATITWQHRINWDGYKGKFQLDHSYIVAYQKTKNFNFEKGARPSTVWLEKDVGGHADAIRESKELFGDKEMFSTPKPEQLMRYLLEITTKKGEIVLDGFSGSGTMGSAAQKMGRRWIMMEIGNQCETHILPRMNQLALCLDPRKITQTRKSFKNFFFFDGVKNYQKS